MMPKRKIEDVEPSDEEEMFDDDIPELEFGRFHRFEVIDVQPHETVQHLTLKSVENKCRYYCIVDGQWTNTRYEPGKFVNIRTKTVNENTFTVNDLDGIIVYSPDTLISCTTVAGSLFCMRKAWLNEKYRGWSPGNQVMLLGSIVHEVFQGAVVEKVQNAKELLDVCKGIMARKDILQECYAQDFSEKQLKAEVKPYLPHIMEWIDLYVSKASKLHEAETKVKVLDVHDIEENIWSPRFGLKGKIDLSAQVLIHENGRARKKIVPMELKTGKTSFSSEHQAQASLYTMMLNQRQGMECDTGMLVYLKDGPMMKQIVAKNNEKQSLIQRRNEVAYYMKQWREGPEFKDVERFCSKCEHTVDCLLHAKYFEKEKLAATREMKKMEHAVIGHLSKAHIEFFGKWVKLLNLELEVDSQQAAADSFFWNESSVTREARGLAIAKLKIVASEETFSYKLERRSSTLPKLSEISDRFKLNQKVAISLDEENQTLDNEIIAITFGSLISFDEESVTVRLDQGIQKAVISCTFRLDVLTSSVSYTYSTHFTNLLRLMMPDDEQSKRLRSLLIDKKPPTFKNQFTQRLVELGKPILKDLNLTQKKAAIRTMSTSDYFLIDGTLETGKVETIVAIVRLLAAFKKSILLTSYSNSTLDAILIKLKEQSEVPFVRLGGKTRVHADLQDNVADKLVEEFKSPAELAEFYSSLQVVATTCLSIYSHPLFETRKEQFDYCILDETSNALLPSFLGPLFYTKKFILVGDSKQQPLVFKSEESAQMGIGESLFASLLKPENTIQLNM